jgi:hypothetical protein
MGESSVRSLHSSDLCWIGYRSKRSRLGSSRHMRRYDLMAPENVEDRLAGCDQIVSDDPPMTSPPHRLRTHDCARVGVPHFAQPCQARAKVFAHGIVRVVMKTSVFPECIHVRRHLAPPSAQAPERCDVFVADLTFSQGPGELLRVVLRIGARPRNGPDIHDEPDLCLPHQVHEFAGRVG